MSLPHGGPPRRADLRAILNQKGKNVNEQLTQIRTRNQVTIDGVTYGVGKTLVVARDRAEKLAQAGHATIVRDVVVNPVEPAQE